MQKRPPNWTRHGKHLTKQLQPALERGRWPLMQSEKPYVPKRRSPTPNKRRSVDAQKRPRAKREEKAPVSKKKPPTSAFRTFVNRPVPSRKSLNWLEDLSLLLNAPKSLPKKTPQFRQKDLRLWGINNLFWRQISPKSARPKLASKVVWTRSLSSAKAVKVWPKAFEKYWSDPSLTLA